MIASLLVAMAVQVNPACKAIDRLDVRALETLKSYMARVRKKEAQGIEIHILKLGVGIDALTLQDVEAAPNPACSAGLTVFQHDETGLALDPRKNAARTEFIMYLVDDGQVLHELPDRPHLCGFAQTTSSLDSCSFTICRYGTGSPMDSLEKHAEYFAQGVCALYEAMRRMPTVRPTQPGTQVHDVTDRVGTKPAEGKAPVAK